MTIQDKRIVDSEEEIRKLKEIIEEMSTSHRPIYPSSTDQSGPPTNANVLGRVEKIETKMDYLNKKVDNKAAKLLQKYSGIGF